jgi:PBP1b-binding outer membrane lipoprotein LpoB
LIFFVVRRDFLRKIPTNQIANDIQFYPYTSIFKTNKMKKAILMALGVTASAILFQSCAEQTAGKKEGKTSNEVKKDTVKDRNIEKQNAEKAIIQNMHDAYKGETTAHFKYEAFSKKAAAEGHNEIALLFKAAAGAEMIHANNHKVILVRMGETIL